jgi:hypothetical protein
VKLPDLAEAGVAWEVTPLKTLLLAPMFLAAASAGDSLSIHYYNRAGVPPRVLDGAVQEAARVLARAGVETVWTEDPPEEPEGRTFDFSGRSPYQHPRPDRRGYLVVSIGRRGQASGPQEMVEEKTLGFALPDADTGVHAFIFFDRVEQVADPKLVTVARMLGNLIAHEVGHVLLGSGQHSYEGIMKARWDRPDYMRAEAGMLRFTAAEGEIIRAHAALRITASNR